MYSNYSLVLAHSYGLNIIKTPNPKCRLYWCLIEWRYSQSCWYFRPLWWTSAPPTFLGSPTPPPLPVWISTGVRYVFIQCVTGGIGLCGEQIQELYTTRLPDSEPAKFLYYPNKNLEGEGASDRWTPAAKYLYWSIFKKSRHLGFGVFIDFLTILTTVTNQKWLKQALWDVKHYFISFQRHHYMERKKYQDTSSVKSNTGSTSVESTQTYIIVILERLNYFLVQSLRMAVVFFLFLAVLLRVLVLSRRQVGGRGRPCSR